MLTSAPFFSSSSFLGQPLLTHLLCLLSFITHNYPLFSPSSSLLPFVAVAVVFTCLFRGQHCLRDPNCALLSDLLPVKLIQLLLHASSYLASLSVACKWSNRELFCVQPCTTKLQCFEGIYIAGIIPPLCSHTCVYVSPCVCVRVCDLHSKQKTYSSPPLHQFFPPSLSFFFLLISHIQPIPTVHLPSLSLSLSPSLTHRKGAAFTNRVNSPCPYRQAS